LVALFPRGAALVGLSAASSEVQSGSAFAVVFLTFVLSAVTAWYVVLTNRIAGAASDQARASREMVERMADASRPLLVPVANFEMMEGVRIAALRELKQTLVTASQGGTVDPLVMLERNHLVVQNIGLGPAVNVGIAVDAAQLRGWSIPAGKAGTRPVARGAKELAYQWKEGASMEVPEHSRLTITYDDLLGRHFVTTARRALHDWHDIGTEQAETAGARRDYGGLL
jgi:hypothetical protein